VATACAEFAGSMVNEVGTQFGSTLDVTVCQVPPKLVSMPEVNGADPPGLQPFPHQPAYVTGPLSAMVLMELPAPVS